MIFLSLPQRFPLRCLLYLQLVSLHRYHLASLRGNRRGSPLDNLQCNQHFNQLVVLRASRHGCPPPNQLVFLRIFPLDNRRCNPLCDQLDLQRASLAILPRTPPGSRLGNRLQYLPDSRQENPRIWFAWLGTGVMASGHAQRVQWAATKSSSEVESTQKGH